VITSSVYRALDRAKSVIYDYCNSLLCACVRVCVTDSCRRDVRPDDAPRTTTTSLPSPRTDPDHSSRFQRLRPSTSPAPGFPFDVHYNPDDSDYEDVASEDQLIRFDDNDDDDDDRDYESSGSRPSKTRPGRGRPQTGSPSLTGSSILSDDVSVDGRPRVFPAPPVHTTSGGRGHQRHVVSVTSSSTSGSGVVRLPVVTSFLAYALAAACFHRATISTVY